MYKASFNRTTDTLKIALLTPVAQLLTPGLEKNLVFKTHFYSPAEDCASDLMQFVYMFA